MKRLFKIQTICWDVLLIAFALFGCEEEEPDYGMDTFAPAVYSEVTQSLDRFQYNPERVRVGTVYHYQKSGITNTWGATLDVYQLNETTIESFKKYSSGSTYVVAGDFDSTLMSFVKQTLYNLDKSGRVESHNFSKVAGRDEFILYDILEQTQSITPVGHYPVFDYSYDSNGIVFLLPHLIDPTSSFEIGMFYVNINIDDKAMIYTGKVQISYQYETSDPKEGCLQAPCLKYSITGEGMMNRQGFLLTNKDQGYVEYMQIPLQNNPTMDGFILQLNGMSEMTQPQWQAHIEKNR